MSGNIEVMFSNDRPKWQYDESGNPTFIVIDLFCGAGGTSTGFEKSQVAIVAACVNHDHKAIQSHWRNYPDVEHFEEDITKLYGHIFHGICFMSDNMKRLVRLINIYRTFYPDAKIILWASLECTNFSKAKGGLPRDADSRTLADHLKYYIRALEPDYVQIENVVEFMSWGPLGADGKPLSKRNGSDYIRWCNEVKAHGYYNEWKEMNSADFGAYTSRNRLFGCFARPELPIVWPTPTHAKKPEKASLYQSLKKWKAVKDVLNFADEGKSIFGRLKDLSEKTLQRIYAGLLKYVAGMKHDAFIAKYYSGRPAGKVISVDGPAGTICTNDGQSLVQATFLLKYNSINGKTGVHVPPSVEEPAPTISTQVRMGLVQPSFLVQRNGGEPESKIVSVESPARTLTATGGNQDLVQAQFLANYNHSSECNSIEEPAPTLLTRDKLAVINPEFLAGYYGNGDNISSVEGPCNTIPTKDRFGLVQPKYFIDKQYGTTSVQSLEQPAGAILSNDKHSLIQCVPFMVDPQWSSTRNGSSAKSVDDPCQTLLAAGTPPSIVQVEKLNVSKERVVVRCNCGHSFQSTEPEYLTMPCPGCKQVTSGSVTLGDSQQATPFLMPTNFDNQPTSIDDPAPTITANRKHHYIVNPSHGGNNTSTEAPCPVIVARQDKAPLYLVQAEAGAVQIAVYEGDSEYTIKIKEFMALYGIVDIKMRMLKVPELLKIQGFPEGYILEGNQSDQKKFIGNSVVPHVVTAWALAMGEKLGEIRKSKRRKLTKKEKKEVWNDVFFDSETGEEY